MTSRALLLLCLVSHVALAQDVKITYGTDNARVKVSHGDSIDVSVQGTEVYVESRYKKHELTLRLSGTCSDGRLVLKSAGKATVQLKNLSLTSTEGAALWFKNKKRVKVEAMKGTRNSLTVTACNDTANHKAAVIWAKGKVHFSGKGELNVLATGNGCKGINAKEDIRIEELVLNVITEGDNLGKDERGFGPPPFGGDGPEGFDGPPPFGQDGMGDFPGPPSFDGDAPEGFGPPPFGGQGPGGFGPPPFGGNQEGADMPEGDFQPMQSGDPDETAQSEFKQRYISTTKAMKSQGSITINGGTVYCKTSSPGAEGIEGKEGIVVNGGVVRVDAIDDAMNANGPICFNGGKVIAESHCNDAVDSNFGGGFPFGPWNGKEDSSEEKKQEPAIVITGGEVYPWSHVGVPEEGLDCDFSPIQVSGGTLFTLGAGMGEMPSVPNQETALQPTVLFTGLTITKGEAVEICQGDKVIYTFTAPFTFHNSASMFTHKGLQKGETYTLRTQDTSRTFTFTENFIVVRK